MAFLDIFKSKQLSNIEERVNQLAEAFVVTSNYPYMQPINNIGTYTPGVDYNVTGSAMRISTFFTCVLVRAEALSTLPCGVFQSTDKGAVPAYTDPAYTLLHNKPNPFQTAADFWKTVSAHIDNNGNCYAIITYSGRFQPVRFDIDDDPDGVSISRTDSGNKVFTIKGKTYRDWEVLHFKDLSMDGVYGCSKVRYNASTLDYSKYLRTYGKNAINTRPPGYFSTEQSYDMVKKQEGNLSDSWKTRIAGGDVPVLPFGLKFNPMMINPDDAQYLDSIDATEESICGFMRVPPTLVQNYKRATFANAEQQDLVFVKYTMLPLITNIEQECNAKLFAEGNAQSANPKYVKFNVNAFMRGDYRTRTDGYRTLIQTGAMTINEARALEEMGPVEGGDKNFLPMNLISLDKYEAFIDKLTEPIPTNAGNEGGADPSQRAIQELLKSFKNGAHVNGH